MATAVCFDLETTGCAGVGVHDSRNRIIQIGAQTMDGKTFNRMVKPECPIPAPSTAIHGITSDMLETDPTLDVVLPEFWAWVAEQADGGDVVLFGHNVHDFDWPVLVRESRRVGVEVPELPRVDTLTVARRAWPHMKSFKLEALYETLTGTQLANAHNAAADVGACCVVFDRLKEEFLPTDRIVTTALPSDTDPILTLKWIGPKTSTKIAEAMNRRDYDFHRNGGNVSVAVGRMP